MKYVSYHAVLAVLPLSLSVPASADVTIKQTLDVTAPGALSLAAMEGQTTTAIANDRSRTDNDLHFKSSIMQRFGGDLGQTSEIVRLDREVIIQLDHKERQFEETTFAQMKAQLVQAMEGLEQSQPDAGAEGSDSDAGTEGTDGAAGSTDLPVDEQSCEWSDTRVDVQRTGNRQSIGGVEAEETRVVATQTCRDVETGKACDLTWTLDNWLAPDVPGGGEALGFWQAYAQKLGYDDLARNPRTPGMAALFSQYQAGWDEIDKHADELQGYPLRTVMSLAIGGEECTTDTGEPLSYDAVFGESMEQALGESAAAGLGESVGGSIGGAVAKSLFGALGKKKDPKPEPASAGTAGSITLFRVRMETTAIDTAAVPADRFVVPAGYSEVATTP